VPTVSRRQETPLAMIVASGSALSRGSSASAAICRDSSKCSQAEAARHTAAAGIEQLEVDSLGGGHAVSDDDHRCGGALPVRKALDGPPCGACLPSAYLLA
jgi:hypothetical protein